MRNITFWPDDKCGGLGSNHEKGQNTHVKTQISRTKNDVRSMFGHRTNCSCRPLYLTIHCNAATAAAICGTVHLLRHLLRYVAALWLQHVWWLQCLQSTITHPGLWGLPIRTCLRQQRVSNKEFPTKSFQQRVFNKEFFTGC